MLQAATIWAGYLQISGWPLAAQNASARPDGLKPNSFGSVARAPAVAPLQSRLRSVALVFLSLQVGWLFPLARQVHLAYLCLTYRVSCSFVTAMSNSLTSS